MILSPNNDGSLEVDWLDVHPDFQCMGIGTLLVEKAAKIAKAKKMNALSVHTSDTNQKMSSFSVKNGFQVFQRIKAFMAEVRMPCALTRRFLPELGRYRRPVFTMCS